MAFAKRPTLASEAAGKPVVVPLKPAPPPAPTSLLDDPDAQSPAGLILRVMGGTVAVFVLAAAVALWMKPAEWWEDEDSALAQPIYAWTVPATAPGQERSTFVRRNSVVI